MARLGDIDPEAIRLLEEADWPWSNRDKAFVEARDPERETTAQYRARNKAQVTYAQLRDHGLAGRAAAGERDVGISWLRETLSAAREQ